MFAAGVPLVESLDAVGGAAGNAVYAQATKRIQTEVSTGTSLTNAMTQHAASSRSMVLQMTQIGEESGSLDDMLRQDRRLLRARGRRRRRGAVEPARADHHRVPGRRHRRPRRRDVPADLQARRRRLIAPRAAGASRWRRSTTRRDPAAPAPLVTVRIRDGPVAASRSWRRRRRPVRRQLPQRRDPPAAEDARARLAGAVRRAARREPARRSRATTSSCPRSACPSCGHTITALREHSRPVLARAAAASARAAARRSRRAIRWSRCSARLLAAVRASGASAPTWQGLAACALLWTLLALTFIDFDTQLLPDDLTLPLLWAGLLVNLFGLFVPLRDGRDRRDRGLPVAVDDLLAVQADPRQGRHGLRRLQAAGRARRLARLADAAADRAAVVGRRRRDRHHARSSSRAATTTFRSRSVPISRSPARSRCSSARRSSRSTSPTDVAIVVGLTGGIGSGKSEVAGASPRSASDVADADAAAHALTARGEAGSSSGARGVRPRTAFAPTATLDRACCAQRVFADAACRARLEALLHPLIRARHRRRDRRAGAGRTASWSFRCCSSAAALAARRARAGRRLPRGRAGAARRRAQRPDAAARCARSWRRNCRAPSGSRAPTTSSTTPARSTRSRRRSRDSTGVYRDAARARKALEPAPVLGHNDAHSRMSPPSQLDRPRDPLRASAERAHPHADAARGPVRARGFFAAQDARARSSCGAARAVRDHRRRGARRSQDRPAAGARAAEADARAAARRIRRSSRACSTRCWRDIDARERAAARAGGQGRRTPARQRMADGDQAAHGDSRRRLRVRPAGVPLLAAPGRRARGATTSAAGSSRSCRSATARAIVLRLLRDNGRASRHTAYRGVFQLMLTTTKVAQLLRLTRRAATCRACRRSARTSTRSTSASSASPAWTAARSIPATSSSSSCSAISDQFATKSRCKSRCPTGSSHRAARLNR